MESFLSGAPPKMQDINDGLADFGFYHTLPQVQRMYAEYANKNLLGYSGGVMEQPEEYWQDIYTMGLLKLWVEQARVAPPIEQVSVFDRLKKDGTF